VASSTRKPGKLDDYPDTIRELLEALSFLPALELARELQARLPSPENAALLRSVYLRYGNALRSAQKGAALIGLLNEAEKLPLPEGLEGQTWLASIVELRIATGEIRRVLVMAQTLTDPALRSGILGAVGDRIVRTNNKDKLLPAEHLPAFDAFNKAFYHYSAGHYDIARDLLQKIPSSSIFVEMKLMLRGLIAWNHNDDAGAVENWKRLTPTRMAAEMIAPIRAQIDPAWNKSQPIVRRAALSQRAMNLMPATGTRVMSEVRRLMSKSGEGMTPTLTYLRKASAEVKALPPAVFHRLANLMYWAILDRGGPNDLGEYKKVFPPHPDDPSFFRLIAMVQEQVEALENSYALWNEYQQWIGKTASQWPASQASLARAIIFTRMGGLVETVLADADEDEDGDGYDDDEDDDDLEDGYYYEEGFDTFTPPKPGDKGKAKKKSKSKKKAKPKEPVKQLPFDLRECYKLASEIAPDWAVPSIKLLGSLYEKEEYQKASELLLSMPTSTMSDPEVVRIAGDVWLKLNQLSRSLEARRAAVKINPLDKRLRRDLAVCAMMNLREKIVANDEPAIAALVKEADSHADAILKVSVKVLEAFHHFARKREVEGTAVLATLGTDPVGRRALNYRLAVEATRLKLSPARKKEYASGFDAALEGKPTIPEMIHLLGALSEYRAEPVAYRGLITHEKKILTALDSAIRLEKTLTVLVPLGRMLVQFGYWKPLDTLARTGRSRSSNDLWMRLFEIQSWALSGKHKNREYHYGQAIARMLKEIEKNPTPETSAIKKEIDELLRQNRELDRFVNNPFRFW